MVQRTPPGRARGASVSLVATLAWLVGAAVLTAAAPGAAQDYQDKGFYQSYMFGVPDDPSEEWLLAYGGRLYDAWWAVLFTNPPEATHPAYPEAGQRRGAETWRCVECHGWDYKGKDGTYATGPHATGIKGIDGMAGADPARIEAILRDDVHGYTPDLLPEQALEALALFVSKGQVNAERLIDRRSGKARGDAARGRRIFQNVCAVCHDYDGMAWITGEEDDMNTLGAIANGDPWRWLHKVLNGQTYADMPAMRVFGLQEVLDVLAYCQTLPRG